MKKTLVLIILLFSAVTQAAPVTELTLTGGEFSMGGSDANPLTPGAFASMSVDGSYDGSVPFYSDPIFPDYASTSIATFEFGFFGPVAVFTAETDGINGPFPGVTGDLTNSTLTLDLSSWTMYHGGGTFNQGAANVLAVVDANGNFSASWDALVNGGAFNGQTGSWTMTGHVSAVPLPMALWLFISGFIGLAAVAKHKK